MLYENEDIQMYNPIDGVVEEPVNVASSASDKDIVALIEKGRKFRELKANAGWKELSEFLTTSIQQYTEMLVWDRDEKRIYRLQEAIKSYGNVFKYVDQIIEEADTYEQERTLHSEANPRSSK